MDYGVEHPFSLPVSLGDFRMGAETRKCVAEFNGGWRIIHDPMLHQPYGLFRIYKRGKYVGTQLSYPCLSDCQWHEEQSKLPPPEPSRFFEMAPHRRAGRPRKHPLVLPEFERA